ncbi:MAG: hypothetical protein NT062_35945, partial [Proteobacteria bacterium]|nr:hypothetical protein [Pseudomonadota bacterium]
PLVFQVGVGMHVDAFDEILDAQVPANPWERRFQLAIERDASAIRQRAVGTLAHAADFLEKNHEAADRIGDALRAVRQSGTHGLVPLFLILEDYRALLA